MVCRVKYGEWVKGIVCGVWSVGTSLLRGSRGLLATCGLSGQVWRVGQGNWRRRVVCRVKFVAWVKRIVGGVWSVGSSMASGSRGLSAGVVCRGENVAWVKGIVGECGLSGQVWRVGQENCRRGVVCRGEIAAWVKGPVGGCGLSGRKGRVGQRNWRRMWSVGTSLLRGSRGLSLECGLSGQVWRVGQRNCRQSLVCRGEKGEWVKRIVGGVWSVGSSMASGSRELATECGLSGRKGRVGQEACWRRVVCRDKFVAWVKGIVGGVWSVGSKRASGSRELSAGVVCRREKGEWVKGTVARVWSVGVKRASEPKKPHISYASNVANCHSDQNCQNPQNMIHLL